MALSRHGRCIGRILKLAKKPINMLLHFGFFKKGRGVKSTPLLRGKKYTFAKGVESTPAYIRIDSLPNNSLLFKS
jgi:hypothetical protein